MRPAVGQLTTLALTWLGAFASLQLFMTGYGLLKSGSDIEAVIGKVAGGFAWVAVCIYIINVGPAFIAGVGDSLFGVLGISLPSADSVMASTFGWAATIGVLAIPAGAVNNVAGTILVDLMLIVLAVGMFVAFKIFMLHLELGLVVMLSPLSFSLLGLNALKDQGIAPFKSLLSLAYRIILLTIILSAFETVGNTAKASITGIDLTDVGITGSGVGDIFRSIMGALGAYLVLAFLVWKSDSIAASLAGGSTSMGTGDIAGAAAAGAAAGAAIMAAGGAAALPSKIPETIKNASGAGSGPLASGKGAESIMNSIGAGAPQREVGASGAGPLSLTTNAGAPLRPGTSSFAESLAAGKDSPSSPTGSGAQSGITGANATPGDGGGASSNLENTLGAINDHLGTLANPQQPSAWSKIKDKASEANRHVSQESANVGVSVSTHHMD